MMMKDPRMLEISKSMMEMMGSKGGADDGGLPPGLDGMLDGIGGGMMGGGMPIPQ